MSMTFEIEIDREDDRSWIAEVPALAGGAPAIVVRDTPPERDDESASGTTASGMARAASERAGGPAAGESGSVRVV